MREQAFDFLEWLWGFPGDSVVKNLPASARDSGSIPGPGIPHVPRSPVGAATNTQPEF